MIHHNPDAEHEKRERERDEILKSREQLEARQDEYRKKYDPLTARCAPVRVRLRV